MRITNKDLKHLEWVYERMKFVHNENENYDYMIRFREILDKLINENGNRNQSNEKNIDEQKDDDLFDCAMKIHNEKYAKFMKLYGYNSSNLSKDDE